MALAALAVLAIYLEAWIQSTECLSVKSHTESKRNKCSIMNEADSSELSSQRLMPFSLENWLALKAVLPSQWLLSPGLARERLAISLQGGHFEPV